MAESVRASQVERRDAAVKRLKEAATAVISERGLDAFTLEEVGARAGFSRGLARYHFGSKERLVAAVVEDLAASARSAIVHWSMKAATLESVIDVISVACKSPDQARARVLTMLAAAACTAPTVKQMVVEMDSHVTTGVAKLIRGAQAAGEVAQTVEPDAAALAIVASLRGISSRWALNPDGFDLRSAGEVLASVVRKGLSPARR